MSKQKTDMAATQRAPKYQNAIAVGLVVLVVGLSIACVQYKASTLLTTIAERFTLSGSGASWVMSIFTLVGIFLALPAGGIAQRFGFKKVMLFSSGLIVVGSLIGALSGTCGAVLIISRAIEGIALTFITTCAPIALQRCVNPSRIGIATGLWGCWGSGGAVLASVLTPQIFELASFEGVWIAFAVFAVIAALLFLFSIREPSATISETVDAPSAEPITKAATAKPSYRDLVTKNTILYLIGFAAMNIIMLALLGMLPSVLQLPDKGFSMQASGLASTVPSLLALISTPVFGAIADRTGRVKPLLIFTYAMLGPCLFLMYTQAGVLFWVGAVCLGLLGFGCIGLCIAGWMQVIPRPDLVPKGMGLLTLVQSVGQFLGTYLVQLLLGPSLTHYLLAGIVLMFIGFAGAIATAFAKLK